MCNYKGVRVSRNELIRLLEVEKELGEVNFDRPVQNGFDYGSWPVIVPSPECKWEITEMEWGFIPPSKVNRAEVTKMRAGHTDENGKWHKGWSLLNARNDELFTNNLWKNNALKRRCLFISSGFFESRHFYPLGKKGKVLKTAVTYPYYIKLKNRSYFFIAGIWTPWTDKETGEYVRSVCSVTTDANPPMVNIHNTLKRMPCILPEKLAGEWLSDKLSQERIQELANYQIPEDQMEYWTVQRDFLKRADPTEPFNYEELPPLGVNSATAVDNVPEDESAGLQMRLL